MNIFGEKKINIALDGPAGSGKSTVAKMLAKDFDILYLDTGAMYRAFALGALRIGVNVKDEAATGAVLPQIPVRVKYENGVQHTYLGGEDVSEVIRKNEVSQAASDVAVHRCVREKLVEMQREIAAETSCVLDGRDIGSYVLPHADFKFYVTAKAEVRAKRRYLELLARGQNADEKEILAQIRLRDEQDAGREFAPLKKAADATEIDTSDMSADEVAQKIENIIKNAVAQTSDKADKPAGNGVKNVENAEKKQKKAYCMTIPANKKGRHVMPFMNFLRAVFIPAYRLIFPFRCYGEKKTKDGPCVYVCNHYRIWDPVYIARTTSEGIHILAKREVMENWFMKPICKKIRCISVNRDGNDVRAMMNALKCLKNGEKVSLFPEGTRNKTQAEMLPFKPGAAAMAIKARVPVVPAAIYKKPKPFKVAHILYGKPFELTEFYDKKLTEEELAKADDIIKEKILGLKREHAEYLAAKKSKKAKKK